VVALPAGGDQLGTAAVRFRTDGSLEAILDPEALFGNFFCSGVGTGASIQPDGKIVVVCDDSAIRLGGDLSFDTAFGQLQVPVPGPAYGLARMSFGAGTSPGIVGLALQPNGRIVIASTAFAPGGNRFGLMRLNFDGSNDSTFGTSGVVLSPALINGSKYGDQVTSMALQPDGKVLVAGFASLPSGQSSIAVVRYLGDPPTQLVNNNQHGLTGSWYQPATDGQGFEVEVFPDASGPEVGAMQVSWFTFDTDVGGGQRWYTLSGAAPKGQPAALTIYQNVGGNFNAPPVTIGQAVGNALLSFDSCASGQLSYRFSFTNASGTIPLTRLMQNVTCTLTGSVPTNSDFALSGNWYDPGTSGQGITVEINPNSRTAFFAWYTYKPQGAASGAAGQLWYTGQGDYVPSMRSIPMQLYRTTGGAFNASAPAPSTLAVGSATLTFQNCTSATFAFRFTGEPTSTTVSLKRIGPVPPGCNQ